VEDQLEQQLCALPTEDVARVAVRDNGQVFFCATEDEAVQVTDLFAPEHLEVLVKEGSDRVANKLQHYGGLFVGELCAEVLGDYAAGPNHTLPTGGTARSVGGLSVFTFLRVRTWMQSRPEMRAGDGHMVSDAAALADLEGLKAHAASARLRLPQSNGHAFSPEARA